MDGTRGCHACSTAGGKACVSGRSFLDMALRDGEVDGRATLTGPLQAENRSMGSSHLAILCALLAAGFSRPAMGDELRPELGGDAWKMERLVTTDGKIHLGLVEAEDDDKLHFLELVRRQGQPMFAVRRPYDKDEIRSLERLSNQERQVLKARWQRYRRRARIQAGRLSSIK